MMKKTLILILIMITIIPLSYAENDFAYNRLYEGVQLGTTNVTTINMTNTTNYWLTDIGTLGTVNSAQFDNIGGTLTIDESHFDLLYCQLTGCTMSGDINMGTNSITDILSTQYNITGCSNETAGTFCYDVDYDTMRFVTISGQVLQMNQETTMPTKNIEGSTVTDGSIVYIMGATGANPNFKLAKADELNTSGLVGVVTKDCNNNQVCPVVFFGLIHGFDTSSYIAGDHLYISATEGGNFTTTPPEFPNVPIWVATVIRVHADEGTIFVFPRLDSSNGITMNTLGLRGDFIQTDYIIRSEEGHANLSGKNIFTIMMNGTTGIDIPHLILQPGGVGMSSVWVRSGIVVPESVLCLNSTNSTNPQCFADEAGFTWNILDFNTNLTEGADWGITGELEVIKDAYVHGELIINGTNTNDLYLNKPGDVIFEQSLQINFTFANLSAPTLENFNSFRIKNLNDTSANSITSENDGNITVSLFTTGSNFATGLNLNNSAGVAATNTDLILATRNPNKNIIMQVINSTGSVINTLIVEGDGNIILQNDLILNLSSIFFDDIGDKFIKTNSDGFPFNGISKNATWTGHNNPKLDGSITYLRTVENDTVSWVTSLKNNSFSLISGNSAGLVPSYMAEENFTENGIINMSKASDYILLCNVFGVDCSFSADTRGNAIDLIPGGPLLFTMGDLEVWQSVKIHKGIAVEGPAVFDLKGNDANFNNGSVHIATPVTFQQGFNQGDSVTKFTETFASTLGIFSNLQTDLGDWTSILSTTFCDEGQCAQADGAGTGFVAMQTNISTLDVNETTFSFVYSLFNMIGSGEISVIVNNNIGSGDITIFTNTTDNVVQSSQSISLPSSMDNQTLISITVNCNVASAAKPSRQCYFDTAKLNGTAITTTIINVSGFDSQICFSDGTIDANGICNVGLYFNASANQVQPQGNWNISGGGGGTSDHSALTNLEWAIAGHTFSSSGQVMDIGSYNFTTNGFISENGSLLNDTYFNLLGTSNMEGNSNFGGFDINNISNANITNSLTVDTNTLFVDGNNNRVGIGVTPTEEKLQIADNQKIFLRVPFDVENRIMGEGMSLKNLRTGSGQWARNIMTYTDDDDNKYFAIGAFGDAQVLGYSFWGFGATPWWFAPIKIAPDGKMAFGLQRDHVPVVDMQFDKDIHLYRDSLKAYFGAADDYLIMWDGSDAVHTITAGDFVFTGGNLGIGTATPAFKLDVIGDGNFDDDLDVGGNLTTQDRYILGNGASIGFNSTCAFIFYNQTGSVIETKGCV